MEILLRSQHAGHVAAAITQLAMGTGQPLVLLSVPAFGRRGSGWRE